MRKQMGSRPAADTPTFRGQSGLHFAPASMRRGWEIEPTGGKLRELGLGHHRQEPSQLQGASDAVTSSSKMLSAFGSGSPEHFALPEQKPTSIQLGEFPQDRHDRSDAETNAPRQFGEVLALPAHASRENRRATAGILDEQTQALVHQKPGV